jgi:hypothetical protein
MFISPDFAPYLISGVLRDHRQSELESISKILLLMCCVPTIITSSLFTGFEHTSNEWNVEELNYEFGIASFLR